MTSGQRNLIIAGLCLFALLSSTYAYEIDARIKIGHPDPVVRFDEYEDSSGFTFVRGIYLRSGWDTKAAFVFGGVAPLIALVVAGYLFLGDPRRRK